MRRLDEFRRERTRRFFRLAPALLFIAGVAAAQDLNAVIAVIHLERAVINTREGQQAFTEYRNRLDHEHASAEARKAEIAAMATRLENGRHAMGEEAVRQLQADIERRTAALSRDSEEREKDLADEQRRVYQKLVSRFLQVVTKYAREHGFSVVLDVGSGTVVYAARTVDITDAVSALAGQNPAATGARAP